MTNRFKNQHEQLLQSLDESHAAYYRSEVFGGPSLHFHLRALSDAKGHNFHGFSESVYALLTAWGMHRMGSGGSKMCEFEKFKASLKQFWPIIVRLQKISPESLDDKDWKDLEGIFRGICCMRTKTSLVGNSKVMAHALPNLVPPIDRHYTLRFLFGTGHITNGMDREWIKLQTILREFFYPMLRASKFNSKAQKWVHQKSDFQWDTSTLKVVDNLVIGFMKK